MWHTLSETEKDLIAALIDAQDPFNKYGAHAGEICECGVPFYPGARLLRVSNRTPAVGSRYFMQRGEAIVPLHQLPEVQSYCDPYFGLVLDSKTALDYFRFAHFFSDDGLKTPLVETPQDLRIDPRSYNPEHRRAAVFIQPPEVSQDNDGFTVSVCTFDETRSVLYRDRYRLSPGHAPQLLNREESGIDLGRPFHDRQLKIGRSDV